MLTVKLSPPFKGGETFVPNNPSLDGYTPEGKGTYFSIYLLITVVFVIKIT
jgi:hypothetical protein